MAVVMTLLETRISSFPKNCEDFNKSQIDHRGQEICPQPSLVPCMLVAVHLFWLTDFSWWNIPGFPVLWEALVSTGLYSGLVSTKASGMKSSLVGKSSRCLKKTLLWLKQSIYSFIWTFIHSFPVDLLSTSFRWYTVPGSLLSCWNN